VYPPWRFKCAANLEAMESDHDRDVKQDRHHALPGVPAPYSYAPSINPFRDTNPFHNSTPSGLGPSSCVLQRGGGGSLYLLLASRYERVAMHVAPTRQRLALFFGAEAVPYSFGPEPRLFPTPARSCPPDERQEMMVRLPRAAMIVAPIGS
jgi:hypothetical protein